MTTKKETALDASPPAEGSRHRGRLGFIAILSGLLGLLLLYFVKVPEGNKEALLLALGIVLGWGSTVVSYEFGSSPSGRKAADAGIRQGPDQGEGR